MPIILPAAGGGVYVVNFVDYLPPARQDGQPWTVVQVEEAAAQAGPWTVLASAPLDPVDTDPANPQSRDFTLTGATLPAGWYRVTFLDADGNQQPFAAILNGPTYTATRDDVARLLRARTQARLGSTPLGSAGGQLGVFNANTTPTGTQVDDLIVDATASVAARIGTSIPEAHLWLARRAVALRAGMLVELSYNRDQGDGDDTTYQRLSDLFGEAMTSIEAALNDNGPLSARAYSVPITSPTLAAQAAYTDPAGLLP